MRILIKISGESIKKDDNTLDSKKLLTLASQIKKIKDEGVEIAIVVGGGNIVRGHELEKLGFDRVDSDNIGMLATIINCLALSTCLKQIGVSSTVMSAIDNELTSKINIDKANKLIKDQVIFFAGGTGNPYFTTDSACALRASQIKADKILMAKNGTDGVYDKDPNKYKDAKKFETLSFNDIISLNLKVMDDTAAIMCRDNHLKVFVFNANIEESIYKASLNKITGTSIE